LSTDSEMSDFDEDQKSNQEGEKESVDKLDEGFKKKKLIELNKNLTIAIRNEDYELASEIRDKIQKINLKS